MVVNSGKTRATQTASRVRDVLVLSGCRLLGDSSDGDTLSPNADPSLAIAMMNELITQKRTVVVLVGHLPHLQTLAASLGIEASSDQFGPAGGLVLEKDADWKMAAHINGSSWWVGSSPPPPLPP